jgi:hypothetical protein
MGPHPANKQLSLFCSEYVLANHPEIIPANIKNYPVAAFS